MPFGGLSPNGWQLFNPAKGEAMERQNALGRLFVYVLCSMVPVLSAASPSFDCSKASSNVERLICASTELSDLDSELSSAYKSALAVTNNASDLKSEQNRWRKDVRDSCSDQECVLSAMRSRIATLKHQSSAPTSQPNAVTTEPVPSSSAPASTLAPDAATKEVSSAVQVAAISTTGSTPPSDGTLAQIPSANKPVPTVGDRVAKLAIVGCLLALVALLAAGMTGNIVVFFDWKDFMNTAAIFIVGVAGFYVSSIFHDDDVMLVIFLGITAVCVLFFAVQTVRLSIKYNRNLATGVAVGLLKILVALFALLFTIGKLKVLLGESKSLGARAAATLALGIFAWFLDTLINGERVYAKKGWALQS